MSYVNQPQHASRTTELLARVPRRHRWVLASAGISLVMLSIAGALSSWRDAPAAATPVQPIIILSTPTPSVVATSAAVAVHIDLIAYFDYHDVATHTAIDLASIRAVVGYADPDGCGCC
jgi:hypothetical protein